ncbi:MAG: Stk1 family PASTA domain-containing Ser/Thr kinase [Clostridia bacterium]|nr:Stk1 family PASTA domain-containing Ser/Thr kinase [Clostridia bacterium]
MTDLRGKIINGRYKIESIVGVGGMSVVYRAYDLAENITVAVKVLKEEFLEDPQFRRRFETESKIISMLNHENIVTIHNVGFNDDLYYIVMEYINGISLKEYIEQEGKLSWENTTMFISQVLKALQHAHSRGVVHRDIKPQNIMLLADGSIKVTDFGIAKLTNVQTHTMTEKAIGSVHYISPEQVSGGVVDERSDIYSVGIMMYEMLTGRVPFDNDNPVSVAVMQLQNNAVSPKNIVPEIPQGLDEIVMKAISKEAVNRFQSVDEFLDDIEKLKRNPSIRFYQKYMAAADTTTAKREETGMKNTGRKKKKRVSVPGMVAIAAVLTAFIVFCITLLALNVGNSNEEVVDVKVPKLVGLYYEDVVENEEYADFNIIEEGRVYSDEYDEGVIVRQDPDDGKTVKKGSDLRVYISLGVKDLRVPDLSNKEYRAALIELSNMGLSGMKEEEESETVPEGYVIRTSPEAGSKITKDTRITIYVSSGVEVKTVMMPSLIGKTKNEASVILGENGLVATFTEVESTSPAETVVAQSIAEGTEVEEGTTVTLSVSKGTTETVEPKPPVEEAEKTKTITVSLPDYESSYTVVAYLNGTQVYSKVHSPSEESVEISLTGKGTQEVQVKIAELNLMIFTGTVSFD